MDDTTRATTRFQINPKLDATQLREHFKQTGRVHIENFLQPHGAEALYKHLRDEVQWRTFVVANENLMGTPPGMEVGLSPQEDSEILGVAYDGARNTFASVLDADRLFPEDETDPEATDGRPVAMLDEFTRFSNCDAVKTFIATVTGFAEFESVQCKATRFRNGHFESFHDGMWAPDNTRRRRASFELNLTPEWKPEWGGILEFRTTDARSVEGFVPCFNALDVYVFPQGHWTSVVSPFAGAPRFAIAGRLYVK
jgi:SM-20-related protein